MYQAPPPTAKTTRYPRETLADVGTRKGAKIGFCLALLYGICYGLWEAPRDYHPGSEDTIWIMGGNLIGFILFVGLGVAVIGGLPSTLVGCLTGYSIGHRLAQYPQRLALERAVLLGCGISLAGIAVTHLIIGPFIFDSNREIYLGLLGIPSVIYLRGY